jgi:hypothetical protein
MMLLRILLPNADGLKFAAQRMAQGSVGMAMGDVTKSTTVPGGSLELQAALDVERLDVERIALVIRRISEQRCYAGERTGAAG